MPGANRSENNTRHCIEQKHLYSNSLKSRLKQVNEGAGVGWGGSVPSIFYLLQERTFKSY